MIKATSAIVLAAVLTFSLTACREEARDAADASGERVGAASAAAEQDAPMGEGAPEPSATPAPGNGSVLDPDGDFRDEVDPSNLDGSFLESVHRTYQGELSDDELIAAGQEVCTDLRAGLDPELPSDGQTASEWQMGTDYDRSAIIAAAPFVYCTEFFESPKPIQF